MYSNLTGSSIREGERQQGHITETREEGGGGGGEGEGGIAEPNRKERGAGEGGGGALLKPKQEGDIALTVGEEHC